MRRQPPALAGPGYHLMGKLLRRGRHEIMGLQAALGHDPQNRLRAEIPPAPGIHPIPPLPGLVRPSRAVARWDGYMAGCATGFSVFQMGIPSTLT